MHTRELSKCIDLRAVFVATLTMALSGCDFAGGVVRGVKLETMPDLTCIERNIARVPGVTNVKYAHNNRYHSEDFTYDAEGVAVLLALERRYSGDLWYNHRYLLLNSMPPKEVVQRVRQVMTRVDSKLEAECHIAGVTGRVGDLLLSCPDCSRAD